jgi:hypothetical protein
MNAPLKSHNSQSIVDRPHETSQDAVSFISIKGVPDAVRAEIVISAKSKYEDNIWDLSEEFSDVPDYMVRMDFSLVHFHNGQNITSPEFSHYLRSVKEYCYSLIVDPPPSHPKWSTCCISIRKGIRTLFRYMYSVGLSRLSHMQEHDFEDFLSSVSTMDHRSGGKISDRTLKSRVYTLSWLYDQSPKLEDGLGCWPFPGAESETEWTKQNAQIRLSRKHRTTPDMPDEVAAKLLISAIDDLKVIDQLERRLLGGYDEEPDVSISLEISENCRSNRAAMQRRVLAASYIIISLLTGMRYHEVANLKHGRASNWHKKAIYSNDRVRYFYFVVSKSNKLQANPTTYFWQTLPITETAIAVLERCFIDRYTSGNEFLFASNRNDGRISNNGISNALSEFVAYHGIRYEGKLWHIATHQFRKKHSRIMVRQGLGLVALQDQLKHFDIEMTKLYGDMNIYTELSAEKFTLSREKYDELLAGQEPIIGGGALEIIKLRKSFTGMTHKAKQEFLNELPRKALIEQVDDGLCMYRPSKALCGGDKASCRPADCNNSILPAASLKRTLIWRRDENVRILKFFENEPAKSAHITKRIEELNDLLNQFAR